MSWASISNKWKPLTPLCLERARAVPLAVDITVSDVDEGSYFLQALLPHVARVVHLSLAGYTSIGVVAAGLPGFFASSMPDLTSLELHQTEEPEELFPSSEVPPVFESVSKIKFLHLTRTPLYPALFGIASLVELRLIGYTNPFHFETFARFLTSNPNLETAVLDVRFTIGSVRMDPARMISLARLRHLSITCAEPIDAKGLLSRVTLPPGIRLEIEYSGSDQPSLASFLPSPTTPIQDILTPIVAIHFGYTRVTHRVLGTNSSFSLSFRGSTYPLSGPDLHLFETTSVREFHLNLTPRDLTPSLLARLMSKLPALETLVIKNGSYWTPRVFDPLATDPLLCPSLKTIAFFDCILASEVMREFEGVVVRRKHSAAAWLDRVVFICGTGVLPDYALIRQLRQHVRCVDARVDDKLPDLS